jgi:hypothetical protein
MIAVLLLQVVIHAREAPKPSIFNKLSKAMHRLYEKEDADVARGNAESDPESALREYEKAPDSPEVAFNRSGALLKINKPAEALAQATNALPRLKGPAAYHVALAIEGMGKPDEAMKAYALALGLDPSDEDSKVNLELLLRTEEERKKKQQAGQPQEQKQPQQGKDEQQQQKGEQEEKKQEKEQGDQQQEQQQQAQKQEKKKEQQAAEEKPVDRSEAERLLDALRAGEKNLQAWRFAKDKRKEARRSEPERDW